MGDKTQLGARLAIVATTLALATGALSPMSRTATAAPDDVRSAAPVERAAKGRTLRITVAPPPSRRARVEIRNPQGLRKVIRKSTTLRRLAPGRYRIKAVKLGLDILARAQAVDTTTIVEEVTEPELQALTA